MTEAALRQALGRAGGPELRRIADNRHVRVRKFGRRWLLCFDVPAARARKGTVAA